MSIYKTKQKDKILEIIEKQIGEFTIKDIYDELQEQIGLTTIYRFVNKLIEDGRITKSIDKNNNTYYQYLEKCEAENHFYLKCENCGNMLHIDCDCIEELSHHIEKNHKFKLNNEHTIINGLCKQCIKK